MTDIAATWPLGTILAGDQCGALPPKPYIQQRCLVREDHVEHGHPHQNYGGHIWHDGGDGEPILPDGCVGGHSPSLVNCELGSDWP